MRRGEVWVASFRPWRGREVGKVRPCLLVQADWLTRAGGVTILVLPLTTQSHGEGSERLRIPLPARDRLKRPCFVMVDKMRAIDRGLFGEGPLTVLSREEMTGVERSLRAVLGIY
ncbi:MAG: type II toxin-antitoxin system PemK/MazF family toxin [Arenicellales bacterium]